jgi:hypothetical protein
VVELGIPKQVTPGKGGIVRAVVVNRGDVTGTYTARLRIDGEVVRTRQVRVQAGHTKQAIFEWNFDTAGTRTVSVGNQSKAVTIRSPPGQSPGDIYRRDDGLVTPNEALDAIVKYNTDEPLSGHGPLSAADVMQIIAALNDGD